MPETMKREQVDQGQLMVQVNSSNTAVPVADAKVEISYTGDPDTVIETVQTNGDGQTETLQLSAPPVEFSMSPGENQPYAEYTVRVSAKEYETVTISGAQIFSGIQGIQRVSMNLLDTTQSNIDSFVIGPHTLWGDYPPKIAEAEIKPVNETGEIVLSRVVIPEYIIVHELTHLKVMNHSGKFWNEMEKVMPEYRECRTWLEKHGKEY
ncbi:YgjP-like metallopeptidase domain-containing protein, partial [Anaerostipes sp.]|uniref:YgjP-like metallopeptidase domain-containing protein n=1 Tax=Anaerostipes sp. TaxID=1872530 RepID=UPI003FEDFF0F